MERQVQCLEVFCAELNYSPLFMHYDSCFFHYASSKAVSAKVNAEVNAINVAFL